jgi:hypothetical protein
MSQISLNKLLNNQLHIKQEQLTRSCFYCVIKLNSLKKIQNQAKNKKLAQYYLIGALKNILAPSLNANV